MLTDELIELVSLIRRQKAEGQTIEVKAAEKGCPDRKDRGSPKKTVKLIPVKSGITVSLSHQHPG